MSKKILLLQFFLIVLVNLSAQDSIKITDLFRFKDGIYLNYKQLQTNNPLTREFIVTDLQKNINNFYELLLQEDQIQFIDSMGQVQKIEKNKIWGYSDKGILYINHKGFFCQILLTGALFYFIAKEKELSNFNSIYYETFYSPTYRIETYEAFLDFQTGQVYELKPKILSVILSRDKELFEEWTALSYRKQKKMLYYYVKKFNERNSVYIKKY